jgi:hypothetical protein
MAESAILNPSSTSAFNPSFGYREKLPEMRSIFQARSGQRSTRRIPIRGRSFDLSWSKRSFATYRALKQWEAQYEIGYFTLADWEMGRYYSGVFDGPLDYSPAGNNQWNIAGTFVELPGLGMFQYPSAWGTDSIFINETDDLGTTLVKLTGAGWATFANAVNLGGLAFISLTLNDTAEWIYYGYGFRLWSLKNVDCGIVEVSLDGVVLGTVDLYSAVTQNAAAVFTQQSVVLGQHRVKLRVTGTKNAASTNFYCSADAIEVMR